MDSESELDGRKGEQDFQTLLVQTTPPRSASLATQSGEVMNYLASSLHWDTLWYFPHCKLTTNTAKTFVSLLGILSVHIYPIFAYSHVW